MRSLAFLVLVLVFSLISCSANAGRPVQPPVSNPEDLPGEFTDGEPSDWREWSNAKNQWVRERFAGCLKAAGIRLSCGGCSAVVVRVIVLVDAEGRIASADTYRSSACGQPVSQELERCMKTPLFERTFPALRGRRFRSMLGTGLSC